MVVFCKFPTEFMQKGIEFLAIFCTVSFVNNAKEL